MNLSSVCGGMESSGLMVLSSAPVPALDASKMPGKVCRQVELAEIIHMPVGNLSEAKRQLTAF